MGFGIVELPTVQSLTDAPWANSLRKFNATNVLVKQVELLQAPIDEALQFAKDLNDLGALPPVPTIADMAAQYELIDEGVAAKILEFDDVSNLEGPCLDVAKNFLKELSPAPFGNPFDFSLDVSLPLGDFSTDLFDFSDMTFPHPDFPNINLPFPDYLNDLTDLYNKMRDGIQGLGIDKQIQKLLATEIPCLQDAAQVAGSISEVNDITTKMGMNLDGTIDDASFGNLISGQVSSFGLPPSITAVTADINAKKTTVNAEIKSAAKEQVVALLPSPVKSLVPKKFF